MPHPTRAGGAAELILGRIAADGLAPGDPLPSEARLVSELGVSRVVVREALKILEGQGIVEPHGGRGTLVRRPGLRPLVAYFGHIVRTDDAGIVELMELRSGLEAFGVRLAAQRRTPAEASAIARLARAMREDIDDVGRFAERDVAFHLAIADAARNALLGALMASIRQAMREAILAGLARRRDRAELVRVQDLHEEIAAAIQATDPDRAAAGMDRHFREAVAALVQE